MVGKNDAFLESFLLQTIEKYFETQFKYFW